uniref:AIG1-type G domain-containing protein n=1 Tax=Varanus komodoensis TaxID=61221 RepID=A0A8D2J6N7_VARKO
MWVGCRGHKDVGLPSQQSAKLRIVLIGRMGSGKSSTGNCILGRDVFRSSCLASSVTDCCQKEHASVQGREVEVVDTPGFCETRNKLTCMKEHMNLSIAFLRPGPHVILWVIKVELLSRDIMETMQQVKKLFQKRGRYHLVVLFTFTDYLKGTPLQEFIDSAGRELRDLLALAEGRCVGFNNLAEEPERSRQVTELFGVIDGMRRNACPSHREKARGDSGGGGRISDAAPAAAAAPFPTQPPAPRQLPGAPKAQESSISVIDKEAELRIVLVGKAGAGKSAAGNTLLGDRRFESRLSAQKPVTRTCRREERAAPWEGKRVAVIDTPALLEDRVAETWRSAEIRRCFELCRPGPHALVFVLQAGRFTEEDQAAVQRVGEAFGPDAPRYMVLLFTRAEDMDAGCPQEYVRSSGNEALQDLVGKCQNRCCAFDNRAVGGKGAPQAEGLLRVIEQMPGNIRHIREDSDILIVLVGKTGGGKSATGNTILGEKKFESKLSQIPVTQTCQREARVEPWKGKRLAVLDTPAIFDASTAPQHAREAEKCRSLLGGGRHVLVFVTQVGRFTREDQVAVQGVEKLFGQEAAKKMVVLFTRKEDLDADSLLGHVERSGNQALQELARKCGGRCCAFNNRATGKESAAQVEELLSVAALRSEFQACGATERMGRKASPWWAARSGLRTALPCPAGPPASHC